jgi:calcium-dependent protein kinase
MIKLGKGLTAKLLNNYFYIKVFMGIDDSTKTKVAIKMLQKALINSDEYLREGLMSEIKVM